MVEQNQKLVGKTQRQEVEIKDTEGGELQKKQETQNKLKTVKNLDSCHT